MAHLLRITDGTNTVTLSSGNMWIVEYSPKTIADGGVIQETATIGFAGGTSTFRSNRQAVNRLFVQAAKYNRSAIGPRVYVEFDPDTSGTVYRSLLYAGEMELPDELLGNEWASGTIEIELTWYRQPFWDGPLTQVPLQNTSTTDSTTDGLTVNNRNDASGYNWADISSSDIIGDLHSSIKLEMINATTDAANPTDEIFIFHNVYSSPSSFQHFIEGESSSDASSTTDANSNSNAYGAFSWAVTTETKIAQWTIPSSDLDDAGGGQFEILARWPAVFPYTNCWLRFKTETLNGIEIGESEPLKNISPTTDADYMREMHMLRTLRLPPQLERQSSLADIALSLYALRSSTDNTINIDYLQLSPISSDGGWLRFKSVDQGVGIDETFYHDDTEGFTYKTNSSGNKLAEFSQFGGPILLVPNQDQRLYFNTCDYGGAAEVAQSWTVKLWYRPRRSSL